MSKLEEIYQAAKALSDDDRWLLTQWLMATFPPGSWDLGPISDEDVAELDRRMAELESGAVEAIPGSEVRKRLREWREKWS